MRTFDQLQADEKDLQDKLAQIAANKIEAAERQRAEQIDQIAALEEQAESYRNQAVKALSDDDKRRLYQYADDAEQQAFQLRKELGLDNPDQPDYEAERLRTAKKNTLRQINGLFAKALFALIAYQLADFTAGQIEVGFISFALKSTAQILYSISAALGGLWLVLFCFYGFVSNYCLSHLYSDFRGLTPNVRVAILAGLVAAFLHLLSAVIPHAI